MPPISPSLSGLSDRDKRLVRAWCALYVVAVLGETDNLTDLRQLMNATAICYANMSAHARCRCQQWLRRYSAAQAKGESDDV